MIRLVTDEGIKVSEFLTWIEETGQFTSMVNSGRVDVWREKMSSNLNIFILAFSATSQWRGQTTLVPRTE